MMPGKMPNPAADTVNKIITRFQVGKTKLKEKISEKSDLEVCFIKQADVTRYLSSLLFNFLRQDFPFWGLLIWRLFDKKFMWENMWSSDVIEFVEEAQIVWINPEKKRAK
jgi:hypothetical protein